MNYIPYENTVYLDSVNNKSNCTRFQTFDVITQGGIPYLVTDGCDGNFRVTNNSSNGPDYYRGDLLMQNINDSSKVSGVTIDGWKGVAEVPIGSYFSSRDYTLGDSLYLTDYRQGKCMRNKNYGSSGISNGHSSATGYNKLFNTDAQCQGKFSDAHGIYAANKIDCSTSGYCSDQPDQNLYNYYINVPTPVDNAAIYPDLTTLVKKNNKPVGESGTCKRGYNWGVQDANSMWVGKDCHATFVDKYNNQTVCPLNWKACSSGNNSPWCSYQVSNCLFSADMVNSHKCDNVDCTKTYCQSSSACVKTYCDANPTDPKCTSVPCAGVDCTKTLCTADANCYLTFCQNNPTNDACTSTWFFSLLIFVLVIGLIYKFVWKRRSASPAVG